jgi:hypothetical protein
MHRNRAGARATRTIADTLDGNAQMQPTSLQPDSIAARRGTVIATRTPSFIYLQETAMISKTVAAAAIGLCLTWGGAYAGPETVQDPQPQAATPAEAPGIGGTNDVIVLELQGGGGAEDVAAMQMLLLQLLMMQAEMGGGELQMTAPTAPGLTGI